MTSCWLSSRRQRAQLAFSIYTTLATSSACWQRTTHTHNLSLSLFLCVCVCGCVCMCTMWSGSPHYHLCTLKSCQYSAVRTAMQRRYGLRAFYSGFITHLILLANVNSHSLLSTCQVTNNMSKFVLYEITRRNNSVDISSTKVIRHSFICSSLPGWSKMVTITMMVITDDHATHQTLAVSIKKPIFVVRT